jgi:hypothetical protein
MTADFQVDRDTLEITLKTQDLRLKTWEAFLERAYKIISLVIAGNLAAAIFVYPLSIDPKLTPDLSFSAAQSIPRFAEGVTLGIWGLGFVWGLSLYIHNSVVSSLWAQKPDAPATELTRSFSFPRAAIAGSIAACILCAVLSCWAFERGLGELSLVALQSKFNLSPP